MARCKRALSQTDILGPQRVRGAQNNIFGNYDRTLRGRKRFWKSENGLVHSYKYIFWRSNWTLGAAKLGEFKRALGVRGGGRVGTDRP